VNAVQGEPADQTPQHLGEAASGNGDHEVLWPSPSDAEVAPAPVDSDQTPIAAGRAGSAPGEPAREPRTGNAAEPLAPAASADPSDQLPVEVRVPGSTPTSIPVFPISAAAGVDLGLVSSGDEQPPNEAVPAATPPMGTGPVGSIPASERRRAWARAQVANWRLFLVRLFSAGLAVVVTVVLLPGLGFVGWRWGDFLRIAVIFGLLNATLKPLLQFLVLRFIFSTYGIVVVLINAVLLLLLLASILDDTFEVYRPVALVVGGLVVGALGLLFETLLGATPPVLGRGYEERIGRS
jgi:putative membrane protein